ncbi:unnamed protein product [Paramecium primaurelia]|uniref:Uncharacterized protein n=1 Tax=Paramecium primaurelia TaxID=5886 RepID=A0A8S1L9L1_PARPR|nr:unnamed protein product [Paramecium primaurelia]
MFDSRTSGFVKVDFYAFLRTNSSSEYFNSFIEILEDHYVQKILENKKLNKKLNIERYKSYARIISIRYKKSRLWKKKH